MVNDLYYRIFIYSSNQKEDLTNIAKSQGKAYSPGYVIVKGRKKPYTDIVLSMDRCSYGDAIVVAKGDIRKISFTEPT